MITLLVCGSMLTSVAFGREHILLGFDSLVLNGPDIPSGCFDPYRLAITGKVPQRPQSGAIKQQSLCYDLEPRGS